MKPASKKTKMQVIAHPASIEGWAYVQISGSIRNTADCANFTQSIRKFLVTDFRGVVIELSHASHICSSFCSFLVDLVKKAKEDGLKIALVLPPNNPVYEMLATVNVHRIIQMYPSTEAWRSACGSAGDGGSNPFREDTNIG